MFSRRSDESAAAPASAGQGAPANTGEARPATAWPWEPDQGVAARVAMEALVKLFPKCVAQNGRLQVETLFCVVGAVTGFAAQYAVRHTHVASGSAKEADVFVIAEATNGERYWFGDRLNAVLVPQALDSAAVWSVVAGAALKLGVAREDLPDCTAIFERVAKSIGTPGFGIPELPAGHKPWLMPRRAIEIFWPSVLKVLTREPDMPVPDFKLVEPRHWPLLLAVVGTSFMWTMRASMPPALAFRIFMEAAIPMSKIDQGAVQFVGAVKQ